MISPEQFEEYVSEIFDFMSNSGRTDYRFGQMYVLMPVNGIVFCALGEENAMHARTSLVGRKAGERLMTLVNDMKFCDDFGSRKQLANTARQVLLEGMAIAGEDLRHA